MKGDGQVLRVSIRELKNRLSYYLRLAKGGRIVEVTERGKPIGQIVPFTPALDERLKAMEVLGILVRSEGKLPPRKPVTELHKEKTVAELLVESRE